jgi:hypothetical protein
MTKSTAQSILEQIRRRQPDPYGIMKILNPLPEEIKFAKCYLSADGWQSFKSRFVEYYGGEKVEKTGLTGNEFLHYIKTSGERENDQFTERQRLQVLLKKLDNENPPVVV